MSLLLEFAFAMICYKSAHFLFEFSFSVDSADPDDVAGLEELIEVLNSSGNKIQFLVSARKFFLQQVEGSQ